MPQCHPSTLFLVKAYCLSFTRDVIVVVLVIVDCLIMEGCDAFVTVWGILSICLMVYGLINMRP